MSQLTVPDIRRVVSKLGEQYGAERIYLFGSYARGDMTEDSNIDSRVDKSRIRGLEIGGLLLDMENGLGRPADLISTRRRDDKFLSTVKTIWCCCMKPLDRDLRIA